VVDADLGLNGGGPARRRGAPSSLPLSGGGARRREVGRARAGADPTCRSIQRDAGAWSPTDRDRFVAAPELADRSTAGYAGPMVRLASLIVSDPIRRRSTMFAQPSRDGRPRQERHHVLGPSVAADCHCCAARHAVASCSRRRAIIAVANLPPGWLKHIRGGFFLPRFRAQCRSTSIPIHSCEQATRPSVRCRRAEKRGLV